MSTKLRWASPPSLYPEGESQSETLIDDVEVFDTGGSSLAIEPRDKLTITWGRLKAP
ncbi:hypothetical protein J4G07_05760 [Candidatus Poribacteria bacterium]|nr:hypothetical protein [Candidatus Poribacteria bacterium]